MSDSNDDLYEQVVELLDGEDVSWIRRVHKTGVLKGIELLAVILHTLRDLEDKTRDPKKIVRDWAPALIKAIKNNEIAAYDSDSYFPIRLPKGFNWVLPLENADRFIEDHGGAWKCSGIVISLFKEEFPAEADEYAKSLEAFQKEEESASNKKRWSDAKLKLLWEESLEPGVTHASLAEKHGLSRQRITALVKQASAKFARLPAKSFLIPSKSNKLK